MPRTAAQTRKTSIPLTPHACLVKGLSILRHRQNWIQGNMAMDARGSLVDADDPKAVRFCSLGVLRHIDGPAEQDAVNELEKAAHSKFRDSVIGVNDGYGYADVITMFQAAIARTAPKQGRSLKRRRPTAKKKRG